MPGHTISSWFWTRSLIRSIGAALVLATAYNNASKDLQEGVDASIFTAETPPMRKSAAQDKNCSMLLHNKNCSHLLVKSLALLVCFPSAILKRSTRKSEWR